MEILNQNSSRAHIYFLGIGGIGLSGLAEFLHGAGFKVSGSDLAENANVKRLKDLGIHVNIGQIASNVEGNYYTLFVTSTAIREGNEELIAVKSLSKNNDIPIVHRSVILGEILTNFDSVCIAGTHGKTTTTALTFSCLENSGAGIINGGVLHSLNTNVKHPSTSKIVVAEADESDHTFLQLRPKIGVITNIEAEHLEHYNGDFELQKQEFLKFAKNCNKLVVCSDDPNCQWLIGELERSGYGNILQRIVTYGFSDEAMVCAKNVLQKGLQTEFDLVVKGKLQGRFCTNLPGRHYVLNTIAAMECAHILGVSWEASGQAIEKFQGVGRRFNAVGKLKGAVVVDDYAHHPTEIKATIAAAKAGLKNGKLVAVIQPHKFTRLKDLMEDFATCATGADKVFVAPVYSAGEPEIEGVNSGFLVQKMGTKAGLIEGFDDLKKSVESIVSHGDIVLVMGAGTSSAWAKKLVE